MIVNIDKVTYNNNKELESHFLNSITGSKITGLVVYASFCCNASESIRLFLKNASEPQTEQMHEISKQKSNQGIHIMRYRQPFGYGSSSLREGRYNFYSLQGAPGT